MLGSKLSTILRGFDPTIRSSFDSSTGAAQLVRLDIQGTQQVIDALRALPVEMQIKIQQKTMRQVLTPLLEAVTRNIPERTGNLKRSIRKKIFTSKSIGKVNGAVVAVAKSRGLETKDNEKGFHASWYESGFKLTAHKKKAKRGPYGYPRVLRSVLGKQPFRRALEAQADSIVQAFYTAVAEQTREAQAKIRGS